MSLLPLAATLGLLIAPLGLPAAATYALDNGLARTPPMGWNSWNGFGCGVTEQLVRDMADTMVRLGMRDLGYEYVVVDDCWQIARSADGTILPSPADFPNGMAALAAYVHERGLKFGLYTSVGLLTCMGRPGSLDYEWRDALTYASWGVDYVKLDWCYASNLEARTQYGRLRNAFLGTGRPVVISISEWGLHDPWVWGPSTGHLWRTTPDIKPNWESVMKIIDASSPHAPAAGPAQWNDPDMLVVGLPGLSISEQRAHFSMWAIMAAPLFVGADLRTLTPAVRDILTNPEVIAVDQDPAGVQGVKVADDEAGHQVWYRPLSEPGARAVVLLNRGLEPARIQVRWSDIGLSPAPATVRDLWARADLGTFADGFAATVPPHDVVMIRVEGARPAWLEQATYLSDMKPILATNGWGPVERDMSNGEELPRDGVVMSIQGQVAIKGLGVHAPSNVVFNLGGECSSLVADIGVDDEVGERGSVVFEVWGREMIYQSPLVTGSSAPRRITVDITGRHTLRLHVSDGGDGPDYDHANWANAAVVCDGPAVPTATPPSLGHTLHLPLVQRRR